MLFTYSPQSLNQNWLNMTIIQILAEGMRAIIEGGEPLSWPESIPAARRSELRGRTGIRARLQKFWEAYDSLDIAIQEELREALSQQTLLPNVLFDDSNCSSIENFPENIRLAAIDLFRFLFEEQLTSLKIDKVSLRDMHYSAIYADVPSRICPFCGLGHFRAPGAPRHALDHYMPITKYPFVGADFRNLPPMCSECNSDFKKNIDILRDEQGQRLHCVDPYDGPVYTISLAASAPFSGEVKEGIHLPRWDIQFLGPLQERAENWDRIFKLRDRYKRDVLNAEFRSWLEHFAFWYAGGNHGALSGDSISASIPEYIQTVIQGGLADKAFLKAETFRMLYSECTDPNRGYDMKAFLEALVTYA